jgi:adenine-specific DNA methylase
VLNVEFSEEYLADKRNPRWVAKPTVAYLWARTVKCKNCRATIPLLKTRWLCKKDNKRVLLTMEPVRIDAGTQGRGDAEVFVRFGIETNVPVKGGNAAQRREHDKRIGAGTMSRSGAKCPCCGTIMEMEDIRLEAQAGRFGYVSTATIVEGSKGKEHRAPTAHEIECAAVAENSLEQVFATVPFGLPLEHTPVGGGKGAGRAFSVRGYGLGSWRDLFTKRQLLALGVLVGCVRAAKAHLGKTGYKSEWEEAIVAYLACGVDRYVDFSNVNVQWKVDADTVNHALVRFAIQITWDFAEGNPIGFSAGSFGLCFNRIATGLDTLARLPRDLERPLIIHGSAQSRMANADLVITDPPYYDAIPYSDLMDWFYVWLRRMVFDLTADFGRSMASPLGPKWNSEEHDGELVDDETRHAGDVETSKRSYEEGMSQAFRRCADALSESGRFVIVFANKSPDAWETLVTSVIKAGFIAEGNWPIQTEQPSRMRGLASAALASSVWLVCKKRPDAARPGWDNQVLEEMRRNIREKLREFWDGGIRGPDFVWAATGPALEAYSKHLVVKKADDPGQVMTVSEFLTNVRRMVVDYVVGRVMYGQDDAETRRLGDAGTRGWGDAGTVAVSPGHRVTASVPESPIGELDEPTAYYLLHRHDFGMDEAPAGACILYAISCGISDRELASTWDLIAFTKGNPATEDTESTEDEDSVSSVDSVADPDAEEESGSKVKLKTWAQRKGSSLGYEAPSGKPVPLIDRAHRLMHLWKAGDLHKVDEYLDDNGLRRQELFKRLLQSLIELSPHGSEERSLLESISNHVQAKGAVDDRQLAMPKNE